MFDHLSFPILATTLVLSVALMFSTTVYPPVIQCGSGALTPQEFVREALPAVSKFELIGAGGLSFNANSFWNDVGSGAANIPIGNLLGTALPQIELVNLTPNTDLRSSSFQIFENHIGQPVPNDTRIYTGQVLVSGKGAQGLAVLYGREDSQQFFSFVSGFILFDTSETGLLTSNWVFIEPLDPLLRPLESDFMPRSGKSIFDGDITKGERSVKEIPSFRRSNYESCFAPAGESSATHIVYTANGSLSPNVINNLSELDTQEQINNVELREQIQLDSVLNTTDWRILLDPVRDVKTVNLGPQLIFSANPPPARGSANGGNALESTGDSVTTIDAATSRTGQLHRLVESPSEAAWKETIFEIDLFDLNVSFANLLGPKKIVVTEVNADCMAHEGAYTADFELANFTDTSFSITTDDVDVYIGSFPIRTLTNSQIATTPGYLDSAVTYVQIPETSIQKLPESTSKLGLFRFSYPLAAGTHIVRVQTEVSSYSRIVRVDNSLNLTDCASEPLPADPKISQLNLIGVSTADRNQMYNRIQTKTWWEGQEEVMHLVEALFEELIDGLDIRVQALQLDTTAFLPAKIGGETIIESDLDAYNALCEYGQDQFNLVDHFEHTHARDLGSVGREVVAFHTGHDFGLIPEDGFSSLSDTGNICPITCSSVGSSIVGLAEGLFGMIGYISNSCKGPQPPTNLEIFNPPSDHLVVQDLPKLNAADGNTVNYQVTLYQRFALLAHEIAHSMGANHQQNIVSIMHPSLTNATRPYLDDTSISEIKACLLFCPEHSI